MGLLGGLVTTVHVLRGAGEGGGRLLWAILGYIQSRSAESEEEHTMKVSDILRVKGNTLYTITPDEPLADAVTTMAEKDIGSLVVMEHGDLVGMLTFREVIVAIVKNGGQVGGSLVRKAMDDAPVTCTASRPTSTRSAASCWSATRATCRSWTSAC
jgi:hypothetical protein